MKKIKYIWMLLAVMMSSFMMTSCDEDRIDARYLSGEWQGDFKMYYDYEYRGRVYTFYSYDTDIIFYPSSFNSTHGTGKQVDYYSEGPYKYQYYYFKWRVSNGVIYFDYPYDPEYNISIDRYYIDDNVFKGRFPYTGSTFRLYKLYDYDWSYYDRYDYYYGYSQPWNFGYGPYYSPNKDKDETGEATPNITDKSEGRIIRRGIRKD